MAGSVHQEAMLRIFRQEFVSVCIYRHVNNGRVYYDIVPCRQILVRTPTGREKIWKRGANYKPADLPILRELISQAIIFLEDVKKQEALGELDVVALT